MVMSLGAVDLGKMRRGLPQSVGHGTGCILSPPSPTRISCKLILKPRLAAIEGANFGGRDDRCRPKAGLALRL